MSTQPGTLSAAEQATGTKDTTYALVSVLYHALQPTFKELWQRIGNFSVTTVVSKA